MLTTILLSGLIVETLYQVSWVFLIITKFATEIETNGSLLFPDVLVTCAPNGYLGYFLYWELPHTNRGFKYFCIYVYV